MSKLKLTQFEVDKMAAVERVRAAGRVYGVGVNDVGFVVNQIGGSIWQYRLWIDVIKRSYSHALKERHPTYKDVTCCDEWLSFATFLEWCNKEVGYKGRPAGMQLDKDLIIKGNKTYSPEACSFLPQQVNKLLTNTVTGRGYYPVGVYYHERDGEFRSQLCYAGKQKCLGYCNTPEDAFAAYKVAKEAQIKVVALQYKDVLKPAVFESLMNWEINIDD